MITTAKSILSKVRGKAAIRTRIVKAQRAVWRMTANPGNPGNLPSSLDLLDPRIIKNPYPYYESLRERGSVHFLKQQGVWLILNYDDVSAAMKQPQIFSNRGRKSLDPVLVGADPPDHTRARQFLMPSFSSRELSTLSEHIEESAQELLAEAMRKNQFDIVSEFAIPLTELAIAHLLGLKGESVTSVRKAAAAEAKYGVGYFQSVERFFFDYIATLKGNGQNDLCSRLVAGDDEILFSPQEIVSLLTLLWTAATATTRMLISTSTHILLHDKTLFDQVQSNKELLPLFIEESLRFDSPTQTIWRVAVHDTTVDGVTIPADADVRLCLGAANRDPRKYDDPDTFILQRNPKDHLAFGSGLHYCLGAGLTRIETQIALRTLLEKCPNLRAVEPAHSVRYEALEDSRALKSLLVTA